MKRVVIAIAFGLLVGGASIASADLAITDTSPKAGASLSVGPNVVSITTSAPLLNQGNLIVVNDPNGVAVDDGAISISGNIATVGIKPLTTTGVYTVTYTLVANGIPNLTGNYTFMYTTPGAIASPTAAPTASSSSSLNNSNNAVSNAFVYFLLFLAALVAIFLVWYAKVSFGGRPKKKAPAPTSAPKRAVKKKI
jgi:copper resistance protein C